MKCFECDGTGIGVEEFAKHLPVLTSEQLSGRRIEQVQFYDDEGTYLRESSLNFYTYHWEYHGDHADTWVIEWQKEWKPELIKETRRFPARECGITWGKQ